MKLVDGNGYKVSIEDDVAKEINEHTHSVTTSTMRHLTSQQNPINQRLLNTRIVGESELRIGNSLIHDIKPEAFVAYACGDRTAIPPDHMDQLLAIKNSQPIEVQHDYKVQLSKQFEEIKKGLLGKDEYENRRAQLFNESVDFANPESVDNLWKETVNSIVSKTPPQLQEPKIEEVVKPVIRGIEDWDIHLSNKPLKTWLVQHIRSTDMPPMAPSIVFHVDDVEAEPINVEHLTNLHLKSQPFDDYTLAYNVMQEHSSEDQYEFIRVMRLRGDMVMCVFAINIFGDWEFKYRVTLNKFQLVNCIPRYPHGDIITSQKFNKVPRTATQLLNELRELSSHAQKQYLRVARFLRDFEDYDQEVVIKLGAVEAVKGRNRTIQESYVEYTLDKSKTKRVKRIEAEERERAKWVKEEPKTREHERIGHKRHLADGRVIKVRGSVVNPGSPLGKVIKDYKFSK